MKKLIIVFVFSTMPYVTHGAFTEFYVSNTSNTASNVNAGDAQPLITSTNGSWNQAVSSFTAASGTPFSGVSTGTFASVYLDGSSTTSYIARISTVIAGGATLVMSPTAFSGSTSPTTSATGRSLTVGGMWRGPSGAIPFPFVFITNALTNTNADIPRVNIQGGTVYMPTAGITHNFPGPVRFEGYTTTIGDGGKATIGTSSNINLFFNNTGGINIIFKGFIFYSTSTTGTGFAFANSAAEVLAMNIIVSQARGSCIIVNGINGIYSEIEAYNCNISNSAALAGIAEAGTGSMFNRLNLHDMTGTNTSGFRTTVNTVIKNSIISNIVSGIGINSVQATMLDIYNTDVKGCGSDGLALNETGLTILHIENSNFISNGGYGINGVTASTNRIGSCVNCGFFGNTSGDISTSANLDTPGKVTYTSNPYVNANTGDFRLKSWQALGTGKGNFEVQGSTFAFVTYPNIGADIKKPFPGGALTVSN